jgi:hypothetical protein
MGNCLLYGVLHNIVMASGSIFDSIGYSGIFYFRVYGCMYAIICVSDWEGECGVLLLCKWVSYYCASGCLEG